VGVDRFKRLWTFFLAGKLWVPLFWRFVGVRPILLTFCDVKRLKKMQRNLMR